ncbi:MAG: phage portal protein [Candidatus Gastranaerophilaceae bacterium]|nr:phage portal protein [Candidatus Gastranaerophilaceae bacterium]
MLIKFDIDENFRKLKWDSDDTARFQNYSRYRELYRSEFSRPFRGVLNKLLRRYPLQNTTAQTLIEVNLFKSLTDFFKYLTTNNDFNILVDGEGQQVWDKISKDNNFITVLKEICVDNSRFGDALLKVAFKDGEVKIFSVCPDCWFPVFNNGNLNDLSGHILLFDLVHNGRLYKHIEKIHKGYIENEIWEVSNGVMSAKITDIGEFGLLPIDDFSDKWNDFVLFPVKNTTESDTYYGESDYKSCESIVEEIMLTISQNSKIINRHANPKLAGSIENTELNPITGERHFPNSDFITMGKDGQKPEYITADLQSDAIKTHIETLMQFFYILTKTPPQAYGIDVSANMSGESLKTILSSSVAKVKDIRDVSLTNAIIKTVQCALAFSGIENAAVKVNWDGDSAKSPKNNVIKLSE